MKITALSLPHRNRRYIEHRQAKDRSPDVMVAPILVHRAVGGGRGLQGLDPG